MNAMIPNRGGAPVGYVSELGPVEAGAVLYLRLWSSGARTQQQMRRDFTASLGEDHGLATLQSFEALCELYQLHGRRPLMRHDVACKCLGADESCFANFIGYASEGAKEDALLMATNLVRPEVALTLVSLAEDFGLSLRRMAIQADLGRDPNTTLH